MEPMLTDKQKELLKRARDTYGFERQVVVSAEECCELSQILLKSLRYKDKGKTIHKSIVTEVADVMIILDHVEELFDITQEELKDEISRKLGRLEAWLNGSSSFEYTTELRALEAMKE